jgi:hypothetical protein
MTIRGMDVRLTGMMLAAAALITTPAFAQDSTPAPPLVRATSDVSIADNIDGLARDEVKTANPLDLLYSYGNNDERVTLYVFRATNANAALWFERADSVLAYVFKSRGLGEASPIAQFTTPGAPSANGLSRVYALSGQYQSTALAVAEINGWIVKIRSTSKSLDPAAHQQRIAKAVAAMTVAGSVAKPHPLVLPEACPAETSEFSLGELVGGEVIPKPKQEDVIMAGLMLALQGQAVTGGAESLASAPETYCRAKLQDSTPIGALYRSKDKTKAGWTMLFADSGRAMSSVPLIDISDKGTSTKAMLTVDQLDRTAAIFLLKGMADPNASLGVAAQVLSGGTVNGLVSHSYDTNTINLPSK